MRQSCNQSGWKLSLLVAAVCAVSGCVERYSTDIPMEYHRILESKYVGMRAWTRLTVQHEKKPVKIEQDQEVVVTALGLQRNGSVTIETVAGNEHVIYPFNLSRPLTLEHYERTLLDILWFESPEERYADNKEKYGARIADAVRDHKILADMSMQVAYLAWGAPTKVEALKRGSDETWEYSTPNLKKAQIVFRSGKVASADGENVSDTEAATKRKRLRRTS